MHCTRALGLYLVTAASSCAAVRGTDAPATNTNLAAATQYWFRGVPQSDALVAQADATVDVPLAQGDALALGVWGNYELSNSAGDAAFGDGHGGDFSEIDVSGRYSANVDEVQLFAGFVHYSFPDSIGRSTAELLVGLGFDGWTSDMRHTATLYYDVDLADDFYATYDVSWKLPLDEKFSSSIGGLVGLMGHDQSELYFGLDRTGFSDVSASGRLDYALDEFTSVWAKATASIVPDGRLRAELEDRGFRSSAIVFTIGVCWSL